MAMRPHPKVVMTRRGPFKRDVMRLTYLELPVRSHLLMYLKTMGFFFLLSDDLRIRAHMAGLNVRATTVEIRTETAIVTVN